MREVARRLIPLGVVIVTAAVNGVARAQSQPTWGGAEVTASSFAWRRANDASPAWRHGAELAWGPTLAVDQGPLRFSGVLQIGVRAFDASSWAIAVSTHAFEVAARLGVLEPQIRAGFALLTLDDFDGEVSAELFSPRVGVGLGVRAGRRARITVGAYAEYFWRWFGPSALVRGLSLDVRYEKPMRPRQ